MLFCFRNMHTSYNIYHLAVGNYIVFDNKWTFRNRFHKNDIRLDCPTQVTILQSGDIAAVVLYDHLVHCIGRDQFSCNRKTMTGAKAHQHCMKGTGTFNRRLSHYWIHSDRIGHILCSYMQDGCDYQIISVDRFFSCYVLVHAQGCWIIFLENLNNLLGTCSFPDKDMWALDYPGCYGIYPQWIKRAYNIKVISDTIIYVFFASF